MALSSEGFCKGVHNFLIPVVILAVIVLTLIAVFSTKENPFLWGMFWTSIATLILYWIYEYSATAQAKYFQQIESYATCMTSVLSGCRSCCRGLPPQIFEPKLWIYILISITWTRLQLLIKKSTDDSGFTVEYNVGNTIIQGIVTKPGTFESGTSGASDIGAVIAMFIAALTFTLTTVLNSSLAKNANSIRLFEVYTGDVVAFAMEVIAFIEDTEDDKFYFDYEKNDGNNVVKSKEERKQGTKEQRANTARKKEILNEAVEFIKKGKTMVNRRTVWKLPTEVITALGDKLITVTAPESKETKEEEESETENKQNSRTFHTNISKWINNKFQVIDKSNGPSFFANGLIIKSSDAIITMLSDPKSSHPGFPELQSRDAFLLSLGRIFQTLYVLPQVTKREFRDSAWPKSRFNPDILTTLELTYKQAYKATCDPIDNDQIKFNDSHIYDSYNKFKKTAEKRLVTKQGKPTGLHHTQYFLLMLLDFVNELYRATNIDHHESQTRRTLTVSWRRLYGTYGDMSTVRHYKMPRVVSWTMEISLLLSCLGLPFAVIGTLEDDVHVGLVCTAFVFVYVGLYISSVRIRNAYVSTKEAIGFQNASATASEAQFAIAEIWEARGIIQQLEPLQYAWDAGEKNEEDIYLNNPDVEQGNKLRF